MASGEVAEDHGDWLEKFGTFEHRGCAWSGAVICVTGSPVDTWSQRTTKDEDDVAIISFTGAGAATARHNKRVGAPCLA